MEAGLSFEEWHMAVGPNSLKMHVVSIIHVRVGMGVLNNFKYRTK
jgi:hypothetical protein